ncbi:DUF2487 family protein [Paenibacillus sp. NEAU-GSW1]|uniref:DUF2487 family protein n=1 Tax=Paenibacillus sp. NEAU-GSW1 TaxID=2682486 RepID=UPI0012E23D96|nr:DUF2487 family protein [Paenibacillus sp. NEAU-GSW1]MUT65462.1 DUF2487 family protein [Paenibacillus sp. NEAU-GSW1]
MKFSDISAEQWEELRPYLDTCLLPVTGMTGDEQPYEATTALERLRDVMDLVEIPFKGRVVTYPAMHYTEKEQQSNVIDRMCERLKQSGFRFVVVATPANAAELNCKSADLVLCPDEHGEKPAASAVASAIQTMWSGGNREQG